MKSAPSVRDWQGFKRIRGLMKNPRKISKRTRSIRTRNLFHTPYEGLDRAYVKRGRGSKHGRRAVGKLRHFIDGDGVRFASPRFYGLKFDRGAVRPRGLMKNPKRSRSYRRVGSMQHNWKEGSNKRGRSGARSFLKRRLRRAERRTGRVNPKRRYSRKGMTRAGLRRGMRSHLGQMNPRGRRRGGKAFTKHRSGKKWESTVAGSLPYWANPRGHRGSRRKARQSHEHLVRGGGKHKAYEYRSKKRGKGRRGAWLK